MLDNEQVTYIYKWNPWIGCHKISEGCYNCSSSQSIGDYYSTINLDLGNFDLPLQRNKQGQYYIPQNSVIALEFNSDFFIQDMDFFRSYIWNIIKARSDCYFITSTKRPERIEKNLPKDWGQGWDNILIACTIEKQKLIDSRLSYYLNIPMKRYEILAQPLIEALDFSKYLNKIDAITAEGQFLIDELYIPLARPCKYEWVKSLYDQCKKTNTNFTFTMTGNKWINPQGQEEIISPYGWDMRDKADKYNLNIGKLHNFNSHHYEFKYINKEE